MCNKSKNKQPSSKDKSAPKAPTWFGTVRELLGWKNANLNKAHIEALNDKMMEWVQKEDSWDFQQFYTLVGITRFTYNSFRKTHPDLEVGFQFAKDILGERRQRKATFKEYETNPNTIAMTLFKYHPDWEQRWKEEKELKLKQAEKEDIKIIIEKE